mmetsp:Transcript_5290/g.14551  ORF Transcript_5290/g.14551 Transcript_5290/m.14551 type:complete len:119 (+) Transcript_5290:159-515(+)
MWCDVVWCACVRPWLRVPMTASSGSLSHSLDHLFRTSLSVCLFVCLSVCWCVVWEREETQASQSVMSAAVHWLVRAHFGNGPRTLWKPSNPSSKTNQAQNPQPRGQCVNDVRCDVVCG